MNTPFCSYSHMIKRTLAKSPTYPRNWAPVGPTSMMRPARPSPSTIGGMEARRCLFTSLHVTRVGAEHFLGGTMIRRPLWRHPRMAPPRASTMKLTRKLKIEMKSSGSNIFSINNQYFCKADFFCGIMQTKQRTLQNTFCILWFKNIQWGYNGKRR